MTTTVLILAAGEGIRFKKDKQLLPIGNEAVIQRIIRQCNQRDATPYVVTRWERIEQFVRRIEGDAHLFLPAHHRWLVDTWLSTRELWGQRTIVLLGDVIYSKALMDRIFDCHEICCVFGNRWEMYGTVYLAGVRGSLSVGTSLKAASEFSEHNGGPGKMRTFYQAYCGLDLGGTALEQSLFEILSWVDPKMDYTRDLDTPEEYRKAVKTLVKRGWLDDLP